ncbi:hypothetical protein ECTPHS_07297 [Ectothiorhodospira sp. PHS-1]|nr:hypothetical protein ECTPHS_07297 [Ectothiorhodospira sp. PHS-1]
MQQHSYLIVGLIRRRKEELELYKLFASDPAFNAAWSQNIEKVLSKNWDKGHGVNLALEKECR